MSSNSTLRSISSSRGHTDDHDPGTVRTGFYAQRRVDCLEQVACCLDGEVLAATVGNPLLEIACLETDFDPVAAKRRGDLRCATRITEPDRVGGQGRYHPGEHRSVGNYAGNVFWHYDIHGVVTGTKFVERSGHPR